MGLGDPNAGRDLLVEKNCLVVNLTNLLAQSTQHLIQKDAVQFHQQTCAQV